MVERVLSSTALGLVLGWVCWSSGSVVPGMLLHALSNGLLLSLAYWSENLKSFGLDLQDEQHLPAAWLVAAALLTAIGFALSYWGRRRGAALPEDTGGASLKSQLPVPAEPNAG
jgi:hypothetical protein